MSQEDAAENVVTVFNDHYHVGKYGTYCGNTHIISMVLRVHCVLLYAMVDINATEHAVPLVAHLAAAIPEMQVLLFH